MRRARWLAELAHALDKADALALVLCGQSTGDEARTLRLRIAALRREVGQIQRGKDRPDIIQNGPTGP